MERADSFDTEYLNELHRYLMRMMVRAQSRPRPAFFDTEEECIFDTECPVKLNNYLRIHKRMVKERLEQINDTQVERAEIESFRKDTGAIINTFYKSGEMSYDTVICDLQKYGAFIMDDSHGVDHAILLRDMEGEDIINLLHHYSQQSLDVYRRKHEELRRHMLGFIVADKSVNKLEQKISILEL